MGITRTSFKKGHISPRRGKYMKKDIKKEQDILNGIPVNCKKHGIHNDWTVWKNGYQCCNICHREIHTRCLNNDIIKWLLYSSSQRAKRKDMKFDLDRGFIEELLIKQENKCAITKIPFDDINRFSIDRIDSSGGYTKDNIQLLTRDINKMKLNFSMDKFVDLCKQVALNN